MKKIINIVLIFIGLFSFNMLNASEISEASALINRVLPGHSTEFQLVKIKPVNGSDVFEIEVKNRKIILSGNNGVSIATAFNWYLKETAHVSYDWQAVHPLIIKGKLPLTAKKTRRVSSAGQRFFNNTCTFGYSFPYWNWSQWQRFIDWLAMNGVNRPLMMAGQEAVWLKVWQSFGLTDNDVRSYFSSPAHLPWHRMANMDKWNGPLPLAYIKNQEKLQQQILERSRSLGMKPILSAFAGHVPAQLKSLFPRSEITQIEPGWGGMDASYSTYFLDPNDSLFGEIQKRFLVEQQKIYGTDHLYSADPFNEITPPSWDTEYLAKVGNSIYKTMASADKDAVWYQMSWTFYADTAHWTQPRLTGMINAVPKGKLVFLDYACEEEEYFRKSNNFQGAPFIWNYLGNFGGNTYLVAPLNKVITRLGNLKDIPNCVGVGSTLEGLNVNPVIYELVLEMPWRSDGNNNVDSLVIKYADRRSGNTDKAVEDAWIMLRKNVLVDSAIAIWNHSVVFQVSPVVDMSKSHWTTNPKIPYKNEQLVLALNRMFLASELSMQSDAYRFDVVNLTRQALGNYGMALYHKMMAAYNKKNEPEFLLSSSKFLQLGFEIDSLLATRHEFLFGKWLADARQWGENQDEKSYYERDAREIVTSWHKAGGGLDDYSNRQWNGLIRSYYMPRWKEFINRLDDSLLKNKPIDEKGFADWCKEFQQKWVDSPSSGYIEEEKGDAVKQAHRLFEKYKIEMMSEN